MSDEMKAIAAFGTAILGAIVAAYIKLSKNATSIEGRQKTQNSKDKAASQKIDQAGYDHLIAKYKDLIEEGKSELRKEIEELREQVNHYQTEHFECAKKLVAATTRIELLENNEKQLRTRVVQLEGK